LIYCMYECVDDVGSLGGIVNSYECGKL